MPHRKLLIRLAKYAAIAVVLACVVWAMHRELAKTTRADLMALSPDWRYVVASGLCLVGVNSVQMIRYRSLLVAYGAAPRWTQMAAIAWIPPLGKYVPGTVWSLMGAIAMLRRFGVNAAVAVSVVLMVDAFSEVLGLTLAVPLLMRPPISDRLPAGRWLAPILLAAGVVVLAPPVLNRVIALALRACRRPPLSRMPTWREYAVPLLTAAAQWAFAGAALWLMTRAVTPVPLASYPHFVAVAACAFAIGYLVILTPAGTGTRELIFVSLLPSLMPADAPHGTVAIVTIAMRLMQVIVEVGLAGLGAIVLKLENRRVTGPLSTANRELSS